MDIGRAVAHLKHGDRVIRAGWNGKGMWLVYIDGTDWFTPNTRADLLGTLKLPWIGMKTADNGFVPWLASQTDILADDWEIV